MLSIFSSSGLTQYPSLPHHAEKEENTEWMWAIENTPAQEVAGQMAVAGGAGGPVGKLLLSCLLQKSDWSVHFPDCGSHAVILWWKELNIYHNFCRNKFLKTIQTKQIAEEKIRKFQKIRRTATLNCCSDFYFCLFLYNSSPPKHLSLVLETSRSGMNCAVISDSCCLCEGTNEGCGAFVVLLLKLYTRDNRSNGGTRS